MIAVIFEVWPKPEHRQEYLDLVAELKPILETIDGFISVERFESLTEKGKILSLSFFRDEDASRPGAMCRSIAKTRPRAGRKSSGTIGSALPA
jgi:heme-degrading monooxygenase HmoA